MDVALKTLVLIIFVLVPGFLSRRVYFQGPFSKQFDSKSWSHSLFYSALFGLLANFITYHCYEHFFSQINTSTCLSFYNSINKESLTDDELKNLDITGVYEYLALLYGLSIVIPWFIYEIVRNFKLDRYFETLRFTNHWHYYFKGEIKDFKEFSLPKGKCSNVIVDILVKSEKDGNNLYSGILSSYTLENNGNLESISLTFAQIFKKDEKKFKDIKSEVFIVPNSNITNINFRYTFEDEDNTTIDFIMLVIFFSLLGFTWLDFENVFSDYTLISKILLKSFTSLISLGTAVSIFSILRYIIYNKNLATIPQNADLEQIKIIETANTEKKLKKRQLVYEIKTNLIFVGLLFSILVGILLFT